MVATQPIRPAVPADPGAHEHDAELIARYAAVGRELLPRERFTSPEFAALEAERLWTRVWQIACRVEELRAPGDFVEYTIIDQSVIVLRTDTGLRAYFNTCPHRGTRLAQGCGQFRGEIRCPFHGWRWSLDGENVEVLDRHEFAPFDDAEIALQDVAVDTWGGFVFVNLDPAPMPLLEFLDPVPAWLDAYHPERMRFTQHTTTVFEANWKVVVDAFNEGYHIAATHPEVLRWKDDAALEYEVFHTHTRYGGAGEPVPSPRLGLDADEIDHQEILALKIQDLIESLPGYFGDDDLRAMREVQRTPLPEGMTAGEFYLGRRRNGADARGLDWSHLTDEQVLGGDDLLIFPNFLGPIVAGGWFTYRVRPNGTNPDSCIFEIWSLEELREGEEREMVERAFVPDWRSRDWGTVINQDFRNMPAIQAGLHVRGPGLRLGKRQEMTVRRFHEVLDRFLFGLES